MNRVLDDLQRDMARKALELPRRQPWQSSDRAEIVAAAKDVIAYDRAPLPSIKVLGSDVSRLEGYSVERIRAESWPGCHAPVFLYLPDTAAAEPLPVVLLLCGHADAGKDAPAYRAMARLLALSGSAVLVIDNIGQGEREAMDHWTVFGPFQAGLTLQGLIAQEAVAWLNWIWDQPRFDRARIAAIGNSGGGMLAMFMAGLERDRLAAVCSSGTLSSFETVCRKEARLCSCTLFPGVVGRVEMWEILASFAPKPLFLFQGREDEFFPNVLFETSCRRVAHTYARAAASEHFRSRVFPGGHPWNDERRLSMLEFLTPILGLRPLASPPKNQTAPSPGKCYENWPKDALNADQLAAQLSGRKITAKKLSDIYVTPPLGPGGDLLLAGGPARETIARMSASLHGELKR